MKAVRHHEAVISVRKWRELYGHTVSLSDRDWECYRAPDCLMYKFIDDLKHGYGNYWLNARYFFVGNEKGNSYVAISKQDDSLWTDEELAHISETLGIELEDFYPEPIVAGDLEAHAYHYARPLEGDEMTYYWEVLRAGTPIMSLALFSGNEVETNLPEIVEQGTIHLAREDHNDPHYNVGRWYAWDRRQMDRVELLLET